MHLDSSDSGSKYWLDGFPELVHEWDVDGNGDVHLDELSAGSGRRVWWTCSRGPDHRWRASPNNRTRGAGCPFCANRRPSVTNTLAALFPEVAAQWHPEKNGTSTPADVVAASTRIVWWRCDVDERHVWHTSVRDRTRDLSSCPFCANRRVCASNSLLAMVRHVAVEWHSSRNGALSPDHVTPGSARRVWWRCRTCEHEWRASVANRVSRASGCPACAGRARVDPSASPNHAAPREAMLSETHNRADPT
jgi:hypothetical protein